MRGANRDGIPSVKWSGGQTPTPARIQLKEGQFYCEGRATARPGSYTRNPADAPLRVPPRILELSQREAFRAVHVGGGGRDKSRPYEELGFLVGMR